MITRSEVREQARKQKQYQAWQVINTAQGKGGSGGRIDALEDLVGDNVLLSGVDLSNALLMGVQLPYAFLTNADMSGVSMSGANLTSANLTEANFEAAILEGVDLTRAGLEEAVFVGASIRGSNLAGSSLAYADFTEADLTTSVLSDADVQGVDFTGAYFGWADLGGSLPNWDKIRSMDGAVLRDVINPPAGFLDWAIHEMGATCTVDWWDWADQRDEQSIDYPRLWLERPEERELPEGVVTIYPSSPPKPHLPHPVTSDSLASFCNVEYR